MACTLKSPVVIKHFHDGIKRFYDMYYRDKHNFIVTFLMHSAINLRYVITLGLFKDKKGNFNESLIY